MGMRMSAPIVLHLLIWCFSLQLTSPLLLNQWPSSQALCSLQRRPLFASKPIDPLDNVREPLPRLPTPSASSPNNSEEENIVLSPTPPSETSSSSSSYSIEYDPSVPFNTTARYQMLRDRIRELQTERAQTLSLEILVEFLKLMRQYLPIISLSMFAFYVGLLIPITNRVERELGASAAVPYLFIGPFLFALPYFLLFLWQFELISIPYIDQLFINFIKYLRRNAPSRLEKDLAELTVTAPKERVSIDKLRDVALMRLFLEMEPMATFNKCTVLKRELRERKRDSAMNQAQMNKFTDAFTVISANGTVSAPDNYI